MAIEKFSDYWNRDDLREKWMNLQPREKYLLHSNWMRKKYADDPRWQRITENEKDMLLEASYKKMLSKEPSFKWERMAYWKRPFQILNLALLQGGLGTAVLSGINENIEGHEQYKGNWQKAMKEGFFQEQGPVTGGDFLYKWGWRPQSKFGKFVRETAGFAIWNLLDPTTYLTVGGLTKAGQAARRGGTLAKTAAEQAVRGERAIIQWFGRPIIGGAKLYDKMSPLIKQLQLSEKLNWLYKGVRGPETYLKQFPEARQAMIELIAKQEAGHNMVAGTAQNLAESIQKLATRYGKKPEDIASTLVEAAERGRKFKDPALQDLMTKFRGLFEGMLEKEKKLGLTDELGTKVSEEIGRLQARLASGETTFTVKNRYGQSVEHSIQAKISELQRAEKLQYVAHVIDPDTAKTVGDAQFYTDRKALNVLSDKYGHGRDFAGTARQVNAMMKDLNLTSAERVRLQKFFSENPAVIMNIRGRNHVRSTTWAEFMDTIRDIYGKRVEFKKGLDASKDPAVAALVKQGFVDMEGVPVWADRFKDTNGFWMIHKELADELKNVVHALAPQDAKRMNEVYEMYQKIVGTWKRSLLASPGYVLRNIAGNIWNAFQGGVSDPKIFFDGFMTAAKATGDDGVRFLAQGTRKDVIPSIFKGLSGAFDLNRPLTANLTYQQAYDAAKKFNVIGTGQTKMEIKKLLFQDIQHPMAKGAKGTLDFATGKQVMEINSFFEDGNKLAIFFNELKKGATPFQASEWAKKYGINYGDIGPADKAFKNVAWFWTWTRKNLPLQIEQAITKPGRSIMPVQKARMTLAGGETPELGMKTEAGQPMIPNWVSDRMAARLGTPTRDRNGKLIGSYFPLENWIPTADLLKVSGTKGAADIFYDLLNPVMRTVIELGLTGQSLYSKKNIKEYKGQTVRHLGMDMPAYVVYSLRNLRILNDLNKLTPKYTDEEIAKLGHKPLDELTKTEKLISFLSGIRIYKYDLEEAKRWYVYKIKDEIQAMRRDAKAKAKKGNEKEARRIMGMAEALGKIELEKFDRYNAQMLGIERR